MSLAGVSDEYGAVEVGGDAEQIGKARPCRVAVVRAEVPIARQHIDHGRPVCFERRMRIRLDGPAQEVAEDDDDGKDGNDDDENRAGSEA